MAIQGLGNRPIFKSTAEATTPADDQVVADSGVVAFAGVYEANVVIGASAAAQFQLQRRNAANDANVGDTLVLYGAAAQSQPYKFYIELAAGERLRLVMDDALGAGTVACAVNLMQMV